MSASRPVLIFLSEAKWGRTGWVDCVLRPSDRPAGFEFTTDPKRFRDAHAAVFHLPTVPYNIWWLRKPAGQIWIACSMECEANYPLKTNPRFLKRFDLTMTYRWDSDIPIPYLSPEMPPEMIRPPIAKTASAPVAYFASNENDLSGRRAYVKELMRYLAVHSYGKSLNNRTLENDTGPASKMEAIARYPFTLAFENSIAPDYVTEKFFEPLIAGSVPIYMGAPNVDEFAPAGHCYLNVRDFAGPRQLAEYLQFLARNEAEYDSYLAWKREPLRASFWEKTAFLAKGPFTRLGEKLLAMRTLGR